MPNYKLLYAKVSVKKGILSVQINEPKYGVIQLVKLPVIRFAYLTPGDRMIFGFQIIHN
jgi:hypothetical protein